MILPQPATAAEKKRCRRACASFVISRDVAAMNGRTLASVRSLQTIVPKQEQQQQQQQQHSISISSSSNAAAACASASSRARARARTRTYHHHSLDSYAHIP